MDSILITIKKSLGIVDECEDFDDELILFTNSVFSTLNQLGVGPEKGFSIQDDTANWSDYLNNDLKLEFVKTYVCLNVKLLFDPPSSSTVIEAINRKISELEWRINVAVDNTEKEGNDVEV